MNTNILITGANGQDGQIIVNRLNKRKVNLFLLTRKKVKVKIPKLNYLTCDLHNEKKLNKLIKNIKIDTLIHLASNNPAYNQDNYRTHYQANFSNTKNLIKILCKYNNNIKIIISSSSRIFKKKKGIVKENSVKYSNDNYSKFRIDIDYYLKNHLINKKNKINYTNLILFNHDSKYRDKKFILPRIVKALKNKNIKFLNEIINKNVSMDFSHADDICEGIIKLIFSKKRISQIILSSGKPTSLNNIIEYLIKKNNLDLNLNLKSIKQNNCLIGNNNFAKKILHWKIKKDIFKAAQEIYLNS